MLKPYDELRKFDVTPYIEKRDKFDYLNWAKCIELLHMNGAETAYFEPMTNEKGSSLFMSDAEFIDGNGNKNRCYEVRVKVVIDDKEFIVQTPLMNGSNPVKDNSMSQQRVWNAQARAFVKGVATHTGLGFSLWLDDIEGKVIEEDLSKHDIQKIQKRVEMLTPRCDMANAWGADLFVSCHYNAGGGDRGEVIHSISGGVGQDVAVHIADQLKNIGQGEVRVYSKPGDHGDYYAVIRETNMPAVIVEPCFIDNEADRTLAVTQEKQQAIGKAIARGILEYYGLKDEASPVDEKLSYDTTVDNMIKDGVTTKENMVAWEQKLAGNAEIKPEEARAIFDRYHEKVK